MSRFRCGGAEHLVLENQHHEVLLIEGQGSLVHPSYSGVTLSLLHGCLPHALIMVFEAGRTQVGGIEHVAIPNLKRMCELFEIMASVQQPCKMIGIAMNGRKVQPDEAARISKQVEDELQLPVVDVIRQGPDRLVDAVEEFRRAGEWRKFGM